MANSRRIFLKTLSLGSAGIILTPWVVSALSNKLTSFKNPYELPPLELGNRQGNKVTFNLTLQKGNTSFFKGSNTSTLGINANYLGPVLRAKRGDTVSLNVTNQIGEESTLHWHGFTLPAEMDGGPHQRIANGKTRNSTFQIRQPASTLWYHSHQYHGTGEQVYKGMAGLFYVDDDNSNRLGIPSTYGVDDLPVVIQDRDFSRNGELLYTRSMHDRMRGKLGNVILVNGVVTPTLKAQKTLLRLRLLNGSNARIYNLAFNDNRNFHVIAGDCSLLPSPIPLKQLTLAPGERAEILVDVSDRNPVILKSLRGAGQATGMMGMMMGGGNSEFDIMRIDSTQAETSTYKVNRGINDAHLVAAMKSASFNPKNAVTTRPMKMNMAMMGGMMGGGMIGRGQGGGFTINNRSFDLKRIDFSVKRGTSEIWEVTNSSMLAHPLHVHNVQFRVLSRNGQRPLAHESALKDTILVNPNERVRILVPFRYYSDASKPYMYHCHILEHEDQGMMGQFTVV